MKRTTTIRRRRREHQQQQQQQHQDPLCCHKQNHHHHEQNQSCCCGRRRCIDSVVVSGGGGGDYCCCSECIEIMARQKQHETLTTRCCCRCCCGTTAVLPICNSNSRSITNHTYYYYYLYFFISTLVLWNSSSSSSTVVVRTKTRKNINFFVVDVVEAFQQQQHNYHHHNKKIHHQQYPLYHNLKLSTQKQPLILYNSFHRIIPISTSTITTTFSSSSSFMTSEKRRRRTRTSNFFSLFSESASSGGGDNYEIDNKSTSGDSTSSSSSSSNDRKVKVGGVSKEDQIVQWKKDAARIRLEAEQLDITLTLKKIQDMENKLNNVLWVKKQTIEDIEKMELQVQQLQKKVVQNTTISTTTTTLTNSDDDDDAGDDDDRGNGKPKDGRSSTQQKQKQQQQGLTKPTTTIKTKNDLFSGNRFFQRSSSNNNNDNNKSSTSSKQLELLSTGGVVSSSSSSSTKSSSSLTTSTTTTKSESTTKMGLDLLQKKEKSKIYNNNNKKKDDYGIIDFDIPGVTVTQDNMDDDILVIKIDTNFDTMTTNLYNNNNDQTKNIYDNEDDENESVELNGFTKSELQLLLPIAKRIEQQQQQQTRMGTENQTTNSTTGSTITSKSRMMNEQFKALRSSPEIQLYFQQKIAMLLIQPMKNIQELEILKQKYLLSSSRKEKEKMKIRIDTLRSIINLEEKRELQQQPEAMVSYCDTIYYDQLQPMNTTYLQQRLDAIQALPEVLQYVLKTRSNLEYNDTIQLLIELEYYDPQIQLLDQIQLLNQTMKHSVDTNLTLRTDITNAIVSLPIQTRNYYVRTKLQLLNPENYTIDQFIHELCFMDPTSTTDSSTSTASKNEKYLYNLDEINKKKNNLKQILRLNNNHNIMIQQKKKEKGTSGWNRFLNNNNLITRTIMNKKNTIDDSIQSEEDDDDDDDDDNNNEYDDEFYNEMDQIYEDIGFIDRSRYIDEFYPAVARMEGEHPTLKDIETFIHDVIDTKVFMVTSKPERIVGGWYIRGRNLMDEDINSGQVVVKALTNKLLPFNKNENNKKKLQFFYVPDPSPLTDEDFELDSIREPLLIITSNNDPDIFYDYPNGSTKSICVLLSFFTILLVAVTTTSSTGGIPPSLSYMNELVTEILNLIMNNNNNNGMIDEIPKLIDNILLICISMISIQAAHELGHKIIAWRDKFESGPPTLIPSLELGLLNVITPFRTPPPTLKSIFDFGITGPLCGFVASIGFLIFGLQITSELSLNDSCTGLPVLPMYLLRSSELGGGFVEYFLGKGIVTQGPIDTGLSLHPFAIAGFLGILSNALALLPLGNTDGGRIAVAMFGRRGAYIVKTFTVVLLCLIGIFDESRIFILYTIFTQLFQRELETPALNEVEELDFTRGAIAITTALFVALALVHIQ